MGVRASLTMGYVPPALTLFAAVLLVTLTVPVADAGHGSAGPEVTVCGQVLNEVGWPVPDVLVLAVGQGTKSADDLPPPAVHTEADGSFQLDVLADRYEVLVHDDRPLNERGWAVYESVRIPVAAHADADPDTCEASRGVALGDVVLPSPANGFVEITVTDALSDVAIEGAEATLTFAGAVPAGTVETGPDGTARTACFVGTTVEAVVEKDTYAASDPVATPCEASADGPNPLTASLWRAAVDVSGTVHDDTASTTVAGASVAAAPSLLVPLPDGHPYTLTTTSGSDGTYALSLPWGDSFTLTAEAPGYEDPAPAVIPVTPAQVGTGIDHDVHLDRITATFAGRVVNLAGDGLAATLTLTGETLDPDLDVPTSSTGAFSVELPHGDYAVDIAATGMNPRSCNLTLPPDAAPTLTPERCLTLLATGAGAVEGTVTDQVTGTGLAGVTVGADTGETTTTDAGASYAFEVLAGSRTLTFTGTGFTPATASADVPNDGFLELGTTTLTRATAPVTVDVVDATTLDPIPGAEVCADGSGPVLTDACATDTDDDGQVAFSLLWSARADGSLDVGDYLFTGRREGAAPIYDPFTCAVGVDVAPGGRTLTCKLTPAASGTITVGPVVDAHTGEPIDGLAVEASSPDLPESACADPYTCEATTDATGIAVLQLPDDARRYTLTATHDDHVDPPPVTDVAVDTFQLTGAALERVARDLDVTVTDAHTGRPVGGAQVELTAPGFTCDPGSDTIVCTGTTDDAGSVGLVAPWGTFALTSLAGAYDVTGAIVPTGPPDEAGVSFVAAATPVTVPSPTEGTPPPSSLGLRLLRAPAADITVTMTDATGGTLDGAGIMPSIEAGGFTCAPSAHDAVAPPAYTCDGTTTVAGAATLSLPHTTAEAHAWALTVRPAEPGTHFEERVSGVRGGDAVDVTLWPTRFDLTVLALAVTDGQTVPFTTVCIHNLDRTLDNPLPLRGLSCESSGFEAGPIIFRDVGWLRSGPDDTGDRFLVTATAPDHAPVVAVVTAGPTADTVTVDLVPLRDDCFPVYFTTTCKGEGGPLDSDGDGWTDAQERVAGTDPEDPEDPPRDGPNDADFDLVPDNVEGEVCARPVTRTAINTLPGQPAGACVERPDGSWDYVPPAPLPPEPVV